MERRVWKKTLVVWTVFAALFSMVGIGILHRNTISAHAEDPYYYWPVSTNYSINNSYSSSHKGMDIAVPIGTDIYAIGDGTVLEVVDIGCTGSHYAPNGRCTKSGCNALSKPTYGFANFVRIKHDNGWVSSYAHLKTGSIKVEEGQRVVAGQVIASSGNAGKTMTSRSDGDGAHLHLELNTKTTDAFYEGNRINPESYVHKEKAPDAYVNVGTNFYAYIINVAPWKTIANDGDNVSLRSEGEFIDKQVWKFEHQSDGSYIIRTCADTNKVLSVDTSTGNVLVKTGSSDSQKWYIYGESANYKFKNKQTGKILDVAGAGTENGTNIQQWEDNGSSAQRFQIWYINRPGSTTLSVTAGTSEKATYFSWTGAEQARNYDLRIYKGTAKASEPITALWNMTGKSCTVNLSPGYYEAYICSVNQAGFTENNIVKFTVKESIVNLGDDFYANIVLSYNQYRLGLSGRNVYAQKSDNSDKQVWYFDRLSDGGYTIKNCSTGEYLDVAGMTDANGVIVQTWEYNGCPAQIWYICKDHNGTYYMRPKCSSVRVLDVRADTMGAMIWDYGGSSHNPQRFTVNKVSAPTYTVSYNANGGSGAPSSQTKTYGKTLTLSNTKPTRIGYTFLGWSTSKTATSATYQPGANYTANAGTTLYAVWKSTMVNLGDDFYANIVLVKNQYRLSLSGNNAVAQASNNSDSQVWYFDRLSDGGYTIKNCNNGRYLDVVDMKDADRVNVQTYLYNGCAAQIWYVYANQYGSYYIRPKCSATRVLDVDSSSLNLQLWTWSSGSHDPQKFTINKVNAPKYTISYDANGGSGAPSAQTKTYNQTLNLSSTKPTRIGHTFLGWSTSKTATSATYQAGASYTANAGATLYAVWQVDFVNLGTRCYSSIPGKSSGALFVRISYNGTNQYLTNTDGDKNSSSYANVELKTSSNATQQVWEMVRQSDGSYIIASAFDYSVLDVYGTKSDNNTNIGMWSWIGNEGQRWYIYEENGKYVLKPVNAPDSYLTADGTTDGSNIRLYDSSETRRYFEIEILEEPERAQLKVDVAGSRSVPTKISWTATDNTVWYNLYFYDGECWNSNVVKAVTSIHGTSIEVQLPPGTYQMHLTSQNYYVWRNSNVVEFTVAEDTYKITYNANGGSGEPSSQTKTYGQTLTLSNTKPTRTGYTFLGWSTSKTATSATYQPGGSYTANAGATLYAVWKTNGSTIKGTATCFELNGDRTLTIRLLDSSGSTQIKKMNYYSDADNSSSNSSTKIQYEYKWDSIPDGTYILEFSKKNHVTRTYQITVKGSNVTQDAKICPIGDVTGDGKVTTVDVTRANQHVRGLKLLTGYELACADVIGSDGKVTTIDVTRINAHVRGISMLW